MANVLINAPKKAKKGDLVEIKAIILHPMETGFRPGTNGRIIPRNIIERFVEEKGERFTRLCGRARSGWRPRSLLRLHRILSRGL